MKPVAGTRPPIAAQNAVDHDGSAECDQGAPTNPQNPRLRARKRAKDVRIFKLARLHRLSGFACALLAKHMYLNRAQLAYLPKCIIFRQYS
jgi:hypothetical protein